MAIFNFRMPKPKQFNYQPLYYDERKERLENLKARAEAELAAKKDAANHATGLQRGFLAERRANSKFVHLKHKKASVLRMLLILIAILGIFYWVAPDVFLAFWKVRQY